MEQGKEYFAFISYKREDEKWAKWLQHKLEHYRLPSNVKKGNKNLPRDLRPVFKDTSELASGVLAEEIHAALENSQYLIVICSPRAAQSEWVCKEVQTFIDMGRTKEIIPFIVGGKAYSGNSAEECFPTALRQLPSEQELLGVNVNEMGRDAAAIKVIARMLGLKFDMLWQRHQKERSRRHAFISAASVFLLTVLVASVWIWRQNRQLQQSNLKIMEAQSRFIVEKINTLIDDGDSYTATLLALNTLPENLSNPNRPYVPESELALRKLAFRQSALLRMETGMPQAVSFTPDGHYLLALSTDSAVQVWDTMTGAPIDTVVSFPFDHIIDSMQQFKTAIYEGFVVELNGLNEHMWNRSWAEPDDSISSAVYSPDGRTIASVSRDRHLRIYNSQTGALVHRVKAHDAPIRSVSFSPDGLYIATASVDGTAKVWESSLRAPIVLEGHHVRVFSAVFSPDGKKVLTTSEDKTAKLWDTRTGSLLGTLLGHTSSVRNAVFSPDGKLIASVSYDKTIRIWNAETLDSVMTLHGHQGPVCSAQFSPDGKLLASVSWDNTVILWNVQTGAIVREWEAHHRGIHSVCFNPDGKRLLTVSWESTAKVWDVNTGRMVHELTGHTGNVTSASFSADGTQIITSSADGTIKTWDFLPLQTLIDNARKRFKNRQLTQEEREKYYLE